MDEDTNIPLRRRDDQGPVDPEFKGAVECLSRENKHMILETEDDSLIECTIQWLKIYDKTLQKKIIERVVKHEEEEEEVEVEVEEEQAEPEETKVPPPEKVSVKIQTDDSFLSDQKTGSSSKKEEPAPSGSSQKGEEPEEKTDDIQEDDTAPKKEPAKRLCHGQDITGNEDDSVFRELSKCFTNSYYDEWAGFYNQGYPASTQHRHMFWHAKIQGDQRTSQRPLVH